MIIFICRRYWRYKQEVYELSLFNVSPPTRKRQIVPVGHRRWYVASRKVGHRRIITMATSLSICSLSPRTEWTRKQAAGPEFRADAMY